MSFHAQFDTVFSDVTLDIIRDVSRMILDMTNTTALLGENLLESVATDPLLLTEWRLFTVRSTAPDRAADMPPGRSFPRVLLGSAP